MSFYYVCKLIFHVNFVKYAHTYRRPCEKYCLLVDLEFFVMHNAMHNKPIRGYVFVVMVFSRDRGVSDKKMIL